MLYVCFLSSFNWLNDIFTHIALFLLFYEVRDPEKKTSCELPVYLRKICGYKYNCAVKLFTSQDKFLIQLNADSLYSFACRSLCLLCLLIVMLIILMLILIESRSILIEYSSGDRKLINHAFWTKYNPSKRCFENLEWRIVKYTSKCLFFFVCAVFI